MSRDPMLSLLTLRCFLLRWGAAAPKKVPCAFRHNLLLVQSSQKREERAVQEGEQGASEQGKQMKQRQVAV